MTLKDALHLGHSRKASVSENPGTTPARQDTLASTSSSRSTEAIPKDNGDVGATLEERLRAWKHLIANLQDYVEQTESVHKNLGREYEKVAKTIAEPLNQSEMYAQQTGGIQSMFQNLQANTTAIAHSHTETHQVLKKTVVAQLEKLHEEIKTHQKELSSSARKKAKSVSKAKEHTKSHIDTLSQHVGHFDSVGANHAPLKDPMEDPYITRRGVLHRLHTQVDEENSHRQELLSVQSSFATLEAHIIQTMQAAMNAFYQALAAQTDKSKSLYGDIYQAVQRVPPDYEWNGFVQRFGHVLIDPKQPNRDLSQIQFPNMDHKATIPLIEGALQRKGKIIKSYNNGYFVVTASKYLHEFKDNDNFRRDPEPELSLYLPDCTIGKLSQAPEAKFNISGKDANKNQTFTREHDFCFKASCYEEAKKWYDIVSECVGVKTNETPLPSPTTTRASTFVSLDNAAVSPVEKTAPPPATVAQETGITRPVESALPMTMTSGAVKV